MGTNMRPSNTFEIEDSRGFFQKLQDEFSDFDKDHLNPRHAINCALTSWHLTDWTYQEFYKDDPRFQDEWKEDKKVTSGLIKYQKYLKEKKCRELEYMRQIANGSKHCKVDQKHRTAVSEGHYAPQHYSRHHYSVAKFILISEDGNEIDFETVLCETISFWEDFLKEH